ncbi:MAG: beta-ketoacyl-[acyl-carrier-protein] synthase family protein [Lachnospiraceae bacterium]|nr:beta-ketoacyl-[acyl-carrier-protein] synthase family protein [Lachnospiraceae bacterium]
MERRVVITGLGAVSPIGNSVEENLNGIKNGVCGIAEPLDEKLAGIPIKFVGEVKNLNMEEYLEKRDIRFSARFCNFARIAAKQAFADSKLTDYDFNRNESGVMISSSIGGGDTLEDSIKNDRIGPYFIPQSAIHAASAMIAMDFKIHGCNFASVSACTGGASAVGEAYLKIKYGLADVMIAGAADSALNASTINGFAAMRALYNGDDVSRASIPFDSERKGFVPGEGAAVLILEDMEQALKRGAHIYAEVVGYGSTCDAFHQTAPASDGVYSALAMEKAIRDAGIKITDIDYINAHGTGTKLNDSAECKAIKNVFREDYRHPYVSSTKSMTGHLLAAGGAIEALYSALSLEHGFIPPTINVITTDEECDINLVKGKRIEKDLRYVMSNSFGFGGQNVSLVFRKYE